MLLFTGIKRLFIQCRERLLKMVGAVVVLMHLLQLAVGEECFCVHV